MSRGEVADIARLARLTFAADELDRMTAELRGILNHVDGLLHIDAPGVDAGAAGALLDADPSTREPADATRDPMEVTRDRTVPDSLASPPSAFAPEWRAGFFTVPRLRSHGGRQE